jgi:hypothetical protein
MYETKLLVAGVGMGTGKGVNFPLDEPMAPLKMFLKSSVILNVAGSTSLISLDL